MVKVSALPVHQGVSGWLQILSERMAGPVLDSEITADWLVIGAGFAGLSAARRLSQTDPGSRIVVLEAGTLAQGACGRNSGFMIDLPHNLSGQDYGGQAEHDLLQIRLNRGGIAFARDVAREYNLPAQVLHACGKINAAASARGEKTNRNYATHLQSLGETSKWLDAKNIQDIAGTGFYRSGLYTPGTVVIQPAAYIRGLAGGLARHMALYENSPALSFERQGSDWRVKTPQGAVTAPKIILAVNGHAQSFGYFPGRFMHVFTYASMTRALTGDEVKALGGQSDWSFTPADPFGATVRRTSGVGGDRIAVRSRFTCNQSMQVSATALRRAGVKHDKHFNKRFAMLRGVDMQYRWAGHLCLSLNGVQAFGEVDEGVFSAVCQNGLGTARGTLAGFSAADLACGEPTDFVKALLAMAPPKRLPPAPIASIGANATMMWHELRAGWA